MQREIIEYQQAEQYAQRIEGAWFMLKTKIFEVATLCAEAKQRLSPLEKSRLLGLLPFEAPTFSKLAKIGADARLLELRDHLPPCYSTIYSLSQLGDSQLAEAQKSGLITSDTRRADVERFRRENPEPTMIDVLYDTANETSGLRAEAKGEAPKQLVLGTIVVSSDIAHEKQCEIQEALEGAAKRVDARFVRRVSREQRSLEARASRHDEEFRSLARKRVRQWKADLMSAPRPAFSYEKDEYSIAANDSVATIEETLKIIGLGDEIDDLHAQVRDKLGL
jgi:hypothetical protein